MSVVKSGKPSAIAASNADLGSTIAQTTPNSINVTNVIGNILSEFDDGAMIVIDPHAGKVIATSSAAIINDIRDLAVSGAEILAVAPDANQSGRSLQFSAAAGNNLAGIDLSDLTTAVKPKFTVESLVARLLTKIQEREAAVPAEAGRFFVYVDQVNKKVGIARLTAVNIAGARNDMSEADVAANAQSVRLTLTPEADSPVSNPLPFEGGAV